MLNRRSGSRISVSGASRNGRDLLTQASRHKPDVVVIDLLIRDPDGFEATRRLAAEDPTTRIIVLSPHAQQRYAAAVLSMGAAAYILSEHISEKLVPAILSATTEKPCVEIRVKTKKKPIHRQ